MLCTTLRKRLQSIGVSVTETTPEMRIAVVMVTANSRNSRPEYAGHEQNRDEHRRERRRHREDRESDFLRSLECRFERRLAGLHVAHDVLEHDDGVVDDEANREDEGHHRQVVEAVVQHLHDREGAEDREGQGERGNERGRSVVQEQEDHGDDQQRA